MIVLRLKNTLVLKVGWVMLSLLASRWQVALKF
jgi:hypothetical protein